MHQDTSIIDGGAKSDAVATTACFVNLTLASALAGDAAGALIFFHPALRTLPQGAQVNAERAITAHYLPIMRGADACDGSLVPRAAYIRAVQAWNCTGAFRSGLTGHYEGGCTTMNDAATAQIQELTERWRQAELAADSETLQSLLDDDFLAVGPLGFLLTKEQWIDRHRSRDLIYHALTWEDAAIRTYGETAISVAAQEQKAMYQGHEIPGRFRVTQIAVRKEGAWVIAGIHLSAIGA